MAPASDPSTGPDEAHLAQLDPGVMEQLLSLDDGQLGLLEEMLVLFKEDTPGRIQALEQALLDGEMAEMADVAHAVKGSAGTMGVPRVRAIAAQLEAAGRIGTSSAPPAELVARLKVAYDEALVALDGFVARKKGTC